MRISTCIHAYFDVYMLAGIHCVFAIRDRGASNLQAT
jgi:hypothetical protein